MAALTFSPPGSGEVTAGQLVVNTTVNALFLGIEGETLASLEVSQDNANFAPILTAQAEEVAGKRDLCLNVLVIATWYIRARFRDVTGTPSVVVE